VLPSVLAVNKVKARSGSSEEIAKKLFGWVVSRLFKDGLAVLEFYFIPLQTR
jgi:hypothetical protein